MAKQNLARILEKLSQSEGDVAPQDRFSASGVTYGVEPKAVPKTIVPAAPMVRGEPAEADDFGGAAELALVEALPAVAPEPDPVFLENERKDIQGNIIPGFNKDYQHFLFYRIKDVKAAKLWLRWIAPMISSMDEVLAFNRMYRLMRFRLAAKDVPVKATWVNIAFSCDAIAALVSKADAGAFGEMSFQQGLAARSEYLGDPTDPKSIGNKGKWVVGGPKNEANILVIVGSDVPKLLDETVRLIKREAERRRLVLIFEQAGATLPDRLRGHEHFGFKDGISQPGLRGRASDAPDDFITPRYIQPTDPRSNLFAKPGQLLVWPGQFVLGMRRQNPEDLFTSTAEANNFPSWARLGSYLVCRRLRQDVKAFWEFAAETATSLGLPTQKFASMLVGRWPSGAPISRTPAADVPALGADDLASNHFLFDDATRVSELIPIPGYPGDTYSPARADILGAVCPHFAHIRKVNPRDSATDLGKVADSLIRMIMRRGIPFGPPVVGVPRLTPGLWKKERGLMFLCYQSSIEDQFEFLTRRWSNSDVQPNVGGHDPIIGQEGSHGSRERFIDAPNKSGKIVHVTLSQEWVIPTGGGYFFAPPISAIAGVLGA
jgi:Dyp-type peroxidase family